MAAVDSAHSIEHSLEHERSERLFNEVIETQIESTLGELADQFEHNENPEDNLDFHNSRHTLAVIDRTERILKTIQKHQPEIVDAYTLQLGRYTASQHDTVQEWDPAEKDFPGFDDKIIFRQRRASHNEATSAELGVAKLDKANKEAGLEIFSEADKNIVAEGIMATVPGYDVEHQTVIQPNLKPDSQIISYALALADLGGAGMDGAEAFKNEGDALFREENLDIAKAFRENISLTEEQKVFYKVRMQQWTESQANFSLGRKTLLSEELPSMLNFKSQTALRELFNKFDESIAGAQESAERRATMTFEELAQDMGYQL
ncbi:hypothetical protein ACFL1U_00575 [Patescibacteria group bacterium]